jgi:hypothetical protein
MPVFTRATALHATLYALLGGAFALVAIGVPTDIIANRWFTRMTPVRAQDVVFLALTVVLAGILAASYALPQSRACALQEGKTTAGRLLSFLAVGCPTCNKLIVLLLGTSGALKIFQPLQPLLGLASLVLLSVAIWIRWRPVLRPHVSLITDTPAI